MSDTAPTTPGGDDTANFSASNAQQNQNTGQGDRRTMGNADPSESLTDLEREVLDEYVKLRDNLNKV